MGPPPILKQEPGPHSSSERRYTPTLFARHLTPALAPLSLPSHPFQRHVYVTPPQSPIPGGGGVPLRRPRDHRLPPRPVAPLPPPGALSHVAGRLPLPGAPPGTLGPGSSVGHTLSSWSRVPHQSNKSTVRPNALKSVTPTVGVVNGFQCVDWSPPLPLHLRRISAGRWRGPHSRPVPRRGTPPPLYPTTSPSQQVSPR